MTKTLFLHVGMPKCASTSIQDAIETHAAMLLDRHGIFYGRAPGDRSVGQGNMARFEAGVGRTNDIEGARAYLRFFLERDTDVILSSEYLIGLARGKIADVLVGEARAHGFDVRLICFIRRQDHWIESDYKQHIKGGSDWTGPMEALCRMRTGTRIMDYDWMLQSWTRSLTYGDMTLVPLEPGQGADYALERFLAFIGLDPARAPELSVTRRNISPPAGLIEPARRLKMQLLAQGLPPRAVSARIGQFLGDAPARIEVPARRFLQSLERRRALLDRYAAANEKLAGKYLGGAPLFDTALEEETPGLRDVRDEATDVLAAYLAAIPEGWPPPPPPPQPAPPHDPPAPRDGPLRRLRALGRRFSG